jgi:hypothetical protein
MNNNSLLFEYKNKVNYLESRVKELETLLYEKECLLKVSGKLSKKNSKRDEVLEALDYLNNKKYKTNLDKQNIYSSIK